MCLEIIYGMNVGVNSMGMHLCTNYLPSLLETSLQLIGRNNSKAS